METILWEEIQKTGITSIDDQHKTLVTIVNRLNELLHEPTTSAQMNDIFRELLQYTQDHFNFEEKLLKKHGYPELEKQQSEHQSFIDCLKDLIERNNSGTDMLVEIDLDEVLRDWLTLHISVEDYLFADFLKSKGAS